MKSSILLGIMFLVASAVFAQETPKVDARQQVQRARIREGVSSGELTRSEAKGLRRQQRHIRRTERRMKSDGTVTAGERARLAHKQNKANRQIRRQKNDAQSRPQ